MLNSLKWFGTKFKKYLLTYILNLHMTYLMFNSSKNKTYIDTSNVTSSSHTHCLWFGLWWIYVHFVLKYYNGIWKIPTKLSKAG